jgi:parvulin-like peptidyl-prolyl isomerase
VVFGIAACGRADTPKTLPPIVAMVGDQAITLEDLNTAVRREDLSVAQSGQDLMTFRKNLLEHLIENRLLLQEARNQHLELPESEVAEAERQLREGYTDDEFQALLEKQGLTMADFKNQLREDLLTKTLVHQKVDREVVIGDEEVKKFYETNRSRFSVKESVRARQIVVGTEEEAQRIRQRLLSGEGFEALAESVSIGPEKERGGDLGFFEKGEMPPEFEVAFSLPVGKISEVVKSPYGFHLFLTVEKRPARVRPLQEVSTEIRNRLLSERRDRRFSEWMAEIKQRIPVRVNYQLLTREE